MASSESRRNGKTGVEALRQVDEANKRIASVSEKVAVIEERLNHHAKKLDSLTNVETEVNKFSGALSTLKWLIPLLVILAGSVVSGAVFFVLRATVG